METYRDGLLSGDNAINMIIDERYEILELVGRGGSGVVYKAMDLNLQREVAVKVLSAECFNQAGQFERFERESQILRSLRAINTVFFYDCGMTLEGLPYIVMEFVVGRSLKTILEEEKCLPPERVVSILMQVFASLQEAHELGFIHRDLKPANIMLINQSGLPNDFVKVLDFGVAKVVTEVDDDVKGELIGTPKYMAPEQFRSEPISSKSDLYSMGCVAYEMLSGHPLFDGETLHVTIAKHLFMTPPAFDDSINQYPNLVATIFKLLQKSPENRFASAQEANDMLAHWREPNLMPQLAEFQPDADENGIADLFNEDDEDESKKTMPLDAPTVDMLAAFSKAQSKDLVGERSNSGISSVSLTNAAAVNDNSPNAQHVSSSGLRPVTHNQYGATNVTRSSSVPNYGPKGLISQKTLLYGGIAVGVLALILLILSLAGVFSGHNNVAKNAQTNDERTVDAVKSAPVDHELVNYLARTGTDLSLDAAAYGIQSAAEIIALDDLYLIHDTSDTPELLKGEKLAEDFEEPENEDKSESESKHHHHHVHKTLPKFSFTLTYSPTNAHVSMLNASGKCSNGSCEIQTTSTTRPARLIVQAKGYQQHTAEFSSPISTYKITLRPTPDPNAK